MTAIEFILLLIFTGYITCCICELALNDNGLKEYLILPPNSNIFIIIYKLFKLC